MILGIMIIGLCLLVGIIPFGVKGWITLFVTVIIQVAGASMIIVGAIVS